MPDYQAISVQQDESVLILSLNKPDSLNALTFQMMDEVLDVLAMIKNTPDIRALVITGSGRGFCSGQDLKDRPKGDDIIHQIMECYFKAFQAIRTCRVPVIMAVNGVAAGGGFSLALTGDIILAARTARFIQIFSRIGLSPDLGSTYLLPKVIGRHRALQYMMTNDPISADQAEKWGLIAAQFEPEDLMRETRLLAHRLAAGPTRALVAARSLVDDQQDAEYEARFRAELAVNMDLKTGFDATEGGQAFMDKRPARFRGV
ncbi:enoyl-CoA hydratase/isomerase family protein [Sneathiella aquimaris]|uniref:enoyl-CoA hydratase/isomerase family protein n=1 Tax=Sneathiella aquimaris TaxID=2599305 RepID=UPI00146A4521|nr:enoyl-CoA hydratase-related protein [Sneathiella aquimaris]